MLEQYLAVSAPLLERSVPSDKALSLPVCELRVEAERRVEGAVHQRPTSAVEHVDVQLASI